MLSYDRQNLVYSPFTTSGQEMEHRTGSTSDVSLMKHWFVTLLLTPYTV